MTTSSSTGATPPATPTAVARVPRAAERVDEGRAVGLGAGGLVGGALAVEEEGKEGPVVDDLGVIFVLVVGGHDLEGDGAQGRGGGARDGGAGLSAGTERERSERVTASGELSRRGGGVEAGGSTCTPFIES